MRDETNYDRAEPSEELVRKTNQSLRSGFGFENIDRLIKVEKDKISMFKSEVKRCELYLKKLQTIRKVVTPDIEASVKALKEVGLV